MTTTAIVDFNLSAGRPYRISVSPSSPKPGDAIGILIDSQDDWTLLSVYGALSNKKIQPAQQYQELINVSGSTSLATTAPVATLLSANSQSPLVNVVSEQIDETAGAVLTPRLAVRNGSLYIDKADLYGSVAVNYRGFQSISWTHDAFLSAGEYVLFAKNLRTNEIERVVINVAGIDSNQSSVPSIVTIQAKDFCTDLPIPGAAVYIDGIYKGVTDSNGKRVVGLLNPRSYSLKIQASGYTSTDTDDLSNESFTI